MPRKTKAAEILRIKAVAFNTISVMCTEGPTAPTHDPVELVEAVRVVMHEAQKAIIKVVIAKP